MSSDGQLANVFAEVERYCASEAKREEQTAAAMVKAYGREKVGPEIEQRALAWSAFGAFVGFVRQQDYKIMSAGGAVLRTWFDLHKGLTP